MTAAAGHALPFHAEHIGSLLRPPELKAAYRAHGEGKLDDAGLAEAVDRSIRDAIRLQEEAGMQSITDGEFRRGSWFLGFVNGVEGLSTKPALFTFSGAHGAWECPYAHGHVHRSGGITTGEFDFVRAHTDRTPKVTMPTPSAMLFFRGQEAADRKIYPRMEDLHRDLVAAYRAELADLAARGCTYVQFDEVPLAMLCDPAVRAGVAAKGEDPEAMIDLYVNLLNEVVAERPAGMTIGVHLCRGNYKGQWMAEGGYAPVAEALFRRAAVDAFFLEYDSERAGDFAPLAAMPADKRVVLGLVSTKSPESPPADALMRRVEAASRHVPLERLSVSPQCGFASSVGGNPVTLDDERRKLALVAEVARRVWG
ncbi:MAG: cobalamin-independent methionine synthase II family protein [Rhodospirillaceae bacterium]|nr:cobalamin-independent methionine synthase II family protein [Rhodospirillaceae bacterium]